MAPIEDFLLPVKRFRTPDGHPTCRLGEQREVKCVYYGVVRFGSVELCRFYGYEIQRDPITTFTVPVDNCPIWSTCD